MSTPTIYIFDVHLFASLCKITTQLRLTEGFFGKGELMTVKSVIITAEPLLMQLREIFAITYF